MSTARDRLSNTRQPLPNEATSPHPASKAPFVMAPKGGEAVGNPGKRQRRGEGPTSPGEVHMGDPHKGPAAMKPRPVVSVEAERAASADMRMSVSLRDIEHDAAKRTKKYKKKEWPCNGHGCHKFAEYVPFTVRMEEGHRTHLPRDDSIPTFCLPCVIAALRNGMVNHEKGGKTMTLEDAKYIGMLPIKEASKYAVACRPSGPAETYRREGFVVIEGDSSINSARDGIASNVGKCIRDRKLGTLDTLYNRKDSEGTERRHNGRRWKNIFPGNIPGRNPGQKEDMWTREWKKKFQMNTDSMAGGLSRYFFPHEHYAQSAYNFAMIHLHGGTVTNDEAAANEGIPNPPKQATLEEKMEVQMKKHAGAANDGARNAWSKAPILEIIRGNVLAKSVDLGVPQDIHADSNECSLNAMQPLFCGNEGYQFRVIRGSNDLLGDKKKIRKLAVPGGEIETWRVKKHHIIVFAECVMHSGGRSSGWTQFRQGYDREAKGVLPTVKAKGGEEECFEGYFGSCQGLLLSDLSLQLSFSYTPIPPIVDFGLAEPHWAHREGEDLRPGEVAYRDAIRHTKGAYKSRLDAGFKTWLKMLVENEGSAGSSLRGTRGRARRQGSKM